MLHSARRTLFLARGTVLRANVYGKGTSAWQAHWFTEEQNKSQKGECNLSEAREASRKREAMKKVTNDVSSSSDYEVVGERWDDKMSSEARRDTSKQSLWERAKGAAQAMKETVGDKMEAAKETISDKYEGAKEVVGEKMDEVKDSMKPNSRTWNADNNLSKTQPLGKTYTKIDSSRKAMNAEVPLTELQGNLSPEDEILSNMAARSQKSDAFHSKDNILSAKSTEELALKSRTRDDKAAAAEHREQWKEERKLRNVTENDMDDFLEPDYVAPKKEHQKLADNLKDTKKAADHTWEKAGNSMIKGLDQTAKKLDKE